MYILVEGFENVTKRRIYGFERTIMFSAISFSSALSLHDVVVNTSYTQLYIDDMFTIVLERTRKGSDQRPNVRRFIFDSRDIHQESPLPMFTE